MRRTMLLLATMALSLLVASGVALAVTKIGGPGPDTLRGTNGADNLLGRGGNDVLFGLGGSDNLLGEGGKDWIFGGNERRPGGGDKSLVGGPGNDGVLGGKGSDNLLGGSGNDVLDLINRPAGKDVVTCGGGFDRVLADRADVVAPDCERVAVGVAAAERLNQQIEESGFYDRLFGGLAPFPG
jgi:Ca2+-binding RTX toxin-like protein